MTQEQLTKLLKMMGGKSEGEVAESDSTPRDIANEDVAMSILSEYFGQQLTRPSDDPFLRLDFYAPGMIDQPNTIIGEIRTLQTNAEWMYDKGLFVRKAKLDWLFCALAMDGDPWYVLMTKDWKRLRLLHVRPGLRLGAFVQMGATPGYFVSHEHWELIDDLKLINRGICSYLNARKK